MRRYANDPLIIKLRYQGYCKETGRTMKRNEEALYYPLSRQIYCLQSNTYRQYLSDRHDMAMEDFMSNSL